MGASLSTNQDVVKILQKYKNIAIVGLSNEPEKDSYHVAEYLQKAGYKIIPVNPKYSQILGEKCYPALKDIPGKIDIVDVFRKSEAILPIAQETLQLKEKPAVFWMQLGIENKEAEKILSAQGIQVIQDKCLKIEHARLK